jgi:membrane protein
MPASDNFDSQHLGRAPRRNMWASLAPSTSQLNPRPSWAVLKGRAATGWKSSLLNLKVIGGLFRETFTDWMDDKAPRLGAALAYYTVFSVAPLLIIATAVAGLVFGEQAAQGSVVHQIRGFIGERGAEAIQSILQSAHKPAIGTIVGLFGIVTLLFGASGVFGELQDALNTVWHVPNRQRTIRECIQDRFPCYLMVLGIGFLLMVSLLLSAALAAVGKFVGGWLPVSENLLHVFSLLLSFATSTLLFAMIFKILPQTRIAWRDVWVGAAVTAALFAIGKWAIGLYIGRSSVASAFGAAGSLVVVMVWVYYSAQIFLLGAEFTRAYAEAHGSRATDAARAEIRVQPAANSPVARPARPALTAAKLGAALALGIGASIGLNFWRRR